MKINVIKTAETLRVELVAESEMDREEILKLITTTSPAQRYLSFPRKDIVDSVKIRLE